LKNWSLYFFWISRFRFADCFIGEVKISIYLVVILVLIIGNWALSVVVESLNASHVTVELPEEFRGYYDAVRYASSQNYLRENTRFGIVAETFMTAVKICFIVLGGFNIVDRFARGLSLGEIPTGLVFAGVILFGASLLEVPFSAYRTFVIESRYGFNKTTPGTFVLDLLKGWFLTALIGGAVFACVLGIFARAGGSAWALCWAAVSAFYVFFTFAAPVLIMPLFNKFIPVEAGELKEALENYARAQSFKMKGLFKMDSSKRSTKSNAFFTGFGKFRRIVLFDTLIEKHTVDELVSVLAHEMGHYKKGHIFKSILISLLNTGVMFFVLSFFVKLPGLFDAFKMQHISVYSGIIFFGFLYSPVNTVVSIAANALSRKYEYEADLYAVSTFKKPLAMIDALKKLSVDNLSNLTPHPAKVFLEYSHPPVLERIKAIRTQAGNI